VRPAALSPLERSGLGVAALVWLAMAFTIVRVPMTSVDGRTLWGLHARLIHDAGRYPVPEYFDAAFPLPHTSYPPLVPVADALVLAAWPGEPALRVFPWLCYLGIAFVLWRELPRRDPVRGRMLALAYALLPVLVLSEEGGADAGVADTVLAAWVLGAALCLDAGRPVWAGLFAAAAALTKNEGLLLGALVLASAPALPERRGRSFLRAGGVFAGVVAPWLWLRASIPSRLDERYLERLDLATLTAAVERLPAIVFEMARIALQHPQRSGVFWWLVLGLAVTASRPRHVWLRGRLLVVAAYVAALAFVYAISPWPDLTQVHLSFERLLLHVAPLALVAIASDAGGEEAGTQASIS
jgi:hypothetical protein